MNPSDIRDDADRRLIDQIRRGYAPPPLTEVERTRFDARLRACIERQQRRRWGLWGLAVTGAAAAVALFALRAPEPLGAPGEPVALPAMAAAPALDDASPELDWLVDDSAADWLGGSTVLPADPLAVPTLAQRAALAAETGAADNENDAEADAETDSAPAYLPDEYTVLAGLIDIEPYDPYAEDWP